MMLAKQLPDKLPKNTTGSLNLKIIVLGCLMCGSLALYSRTTQPKIVELYDSQPSNYSETVDTLADSYLKIAEYSVNRSGTKCFRQSINDCLEYLSPDNPKNITGDTQEEMIRYQLRMLVYQTRLDAIKLAKERASVKKNQSRLI